MTTTYENLVQVFNQLFETILARRKDYRSALLGDGHGNIAVPGREDYVFAREGKNSIREWQVFNKRVTGTDGTPILIGELPWAPGLEQVVSVDWAAYSIQEWQSWYSGVAAHAASHQYQNENNPGVDKLLVYQPALQMLKSTGDGTSLTISVNKLVYQYSGISRLFPGGTIDLTSYVPSAGYALSMLVSLRQDTGILTVTAGTEIPDTGIAPPKPPIPTNEIASAYIALVGGQSVIDNTDIDDARDFLGGESSMPTGEDGQVLVNINGVFTATTPITDDGGWLVDESTGKLIVDI